MPTKLLLNSHGNITQGISIDELKQILKNPPDFHKIDARKIKPDDLTFITKGAPSINAYPKDFFIADHFESEMFSRKAVTLSLDPNQNDYKDCLTAINATIKKNMISRLKGYIHLEGDQKEEFLEQKIKLMILLNGSLV